MARPRFWRGQQLGKYKLIERLGVGGFAVVYRARDSVEGHDVALKLPTTPYGADSRETLLREVRVGLRLDHPNILPIRNADFVGDQLIIAYPLGKESLARRLKRRISNQRAVSIAEQLLAAMAYAHARRVIHCDINPSNVILFADDHVLLADFGLARVAAQSIIFGSGSGTVGYIAPEQAMGHPSFRSDVFALGLVIYRLFAGELPRWPYRWPLPGADRVRRKLSPEALAWLRRALEVEDRRRYGNAGSMLRAYERLRAVLR